MPAPLGSEPTPAHPGGHPRRGEEKTPPPEDLAELLAVHGSYAAVARLFGVSKSAVAHRARKHGIKSPRRRVPTWRCAHCLTPGDERALLRFGLSVRRGGRQRGAGSIVLCEACWQTLRLRRPYTIG